MLQNFKPVELNKNVKMVDLCNIVIFQAYLILLEMIKADAVYGNYIANKLA